MDSDRWFVVASNVLGGCQGATGPSSEAPDGRPWGSRFPFVTIRDQVAAEAALTDQLGISAYASAEQIAWCQPQMLARTWASPAVTTTTSRRVPTSGSGWLAESPR